MKPTKQQELIIVYNGCSVVIASPGSGKTFVLSKKIKQNFKELKEHQGVIAISYTNKASNELRNRSLSDGENPLSSFFGTIDKFYISEIILPFGKQIWGFPENEIVVDRIDSLDSQDQKSFKLV
ncbi:MAG: UvrD-helicase domain-containing protein [Chloroflexia bacterium]|nr:UvrD-helicase domain-containing protein [Chloroflexia bacterium]